MASSCVICGTLKPTLPQVIDAFRAVLQVLESQTLKLEDENAQKFEKLKHQLDEVTTKSRSIEEAKINAEKRSDLYKSRFLDAQKAIEQLHEKNIQLSGRRSQKSSQFSPDAHRQFPFAPKDEFPPESKKVILAPDTCALETDVTYISSDEEDFRQEAKVKSKSKSPKAERLKTAQKSVMESFFVKPKSFPKKRKLSADTQKQFTDLDETRFDGLVDSIALDSSELDKFDEEMDSIPPSPVLSGGKDRRFGAFQRTREFPKLKSFSEKSNKSPRGEDAKKNFPVTSILQKEGDNPSLKKMQSKLLDSPSRQEDRKVFNKQQTTVTSCNELQGNTSLDELFNKTYGDLETTTMMNETTFEKKDQEESDDDLDALLLEGVEDNVLDPTPLNAASSSAGKIDDSPVLTNISNQKDNLQWEDSFDVPRKKQEEKNFKYQEVVRKHDERGKLDGKTCAQCDAYYSDVPEAERRELLRTVCRHKHVNLPPSTPEHFWEVEIPNTEECRRRGYFMDEKDLPLEERSNETRLRRKKPLEPFFSKKK